jgi:peptidoglycan hydrolase-like protein with peptidoglycan-binding domain
MTRNHDITIEQLNQVERDFSLPRNILWAMSMVESSGRAGAIGDDGLSLGRFQLMMGAGGGVADLRKNFSAFSSFTPGQDCLVDARAAATFLRFNDTQYLTGTDNNIVMMLIAYNAGGGRVNERGFRVAGQHSYNYVARHFGFLVNNGDLDTARIIIQDAEAIPDGLIDINRFYANCYSTSASREEIRELQTALQATGHYRGAIDGIMGNGTINAAIAQANAVGNGGLIYQAIQREIASEGPMASTPFLPILTPPPSNDELTRNRWARLGVDLSWMDDFNLTRRPTVTPPNDGWRAPLLPGYTMTPTATSSFMPQIATADEQAILNAFNQQGRTEVNLRGDVETNTAVRDLQEALGVRVDGIVGHRTRAAFDSSRFNTNNDDPLSLGELRAALTSIRQDRARQRD